MSDPTENAALRAVEEAIWTQAACAALTGISAQIMNWGNAAKFAAGAADEIVKEWRKRFLEGASETK